MNTKSSLLWLARFIVAHFIVILFLATGCASVENWLEETEENLYNPNTVRVIKGTIVNVGRGRGSDLDLKLTSRDNETFSIAVGPVWYLRRLNINFQEGEEITVVGSVIDADEGIVIAQQIKRRRTKFVFRSQSGEPRWNNSSLFNRGGSSGPRSSAAFAPASGAF